MSDQPATVGTCTDFDVPADVAYFNAANLAPQLFAVKAAGAATLALRARPWMIQAEDWFSDVERLRALFAPSVGSDTDGVALIPRPATASQSQRETYD